MPMRKCETMKTMKVSVKILCILMLLLHKSNQQQTFNDEKMLYLPVNYTVGWMAVLDDETLISDITIPGTHDAMALHGGPAAECQSWSLENQLKAGIRYLDVRVSGKNLEIIHGPLSQHTTFFAAFETIKAFLSLFPTETVLVRLKHENHKFPEGVMLRLENEPDCWVRSEIPRMKEVRGKVVFVQKYGFRLGISLSETDQNGDYKVKNVNNKEAEIIAHLKKASEGCKSGSFFLNYSSGTGWPVLKLYLTPKHVAREINPWLYEFLIKNYKNANKPCFGVIAMDFPGFDLIQLIIGLNK